MPKTRKAAITTSVTRENSHGLTTKTRPMPRWLPHLPAQYVERWRRQNWQPFMMKAIPILWRIVRKTVIITIKPRTRLLARPLAVHIARLCLPSGMTWQKSNWLIKIYQSECQRDGCGHIGYYATSDGTVVANETYDLGGRRMPAGSQRNGFYIENGKVIYKK